MVACYLVSGLDANQAEPPAPLRVAIACWMPQTWARINQENKGMRVVYTRYDPDDVRQCPDVREHVVRSLFWAAGRDLEKMKRAAR